MYKLTANEVKQAKAADKRVKLTDGGGLYLLIDPEGGRYWRYDYRYNSKRKTMALGVYPKTSLKRARQKHFEAREKLNQGIDPAEYKKLEKLTSKIAAANSFEAIALEWFETRVSDLSEGHKKRTRRVLERDLFPSLANRPITNINAVELLSALRKIEDREAIETAHRAKRIAGRVFRYAIATGRAERDPSRDLEGALKNPKTQHRAAITDPIEVGKLLVSIDGYRGSPTVSAALRLSPLLFQRPGEIRAMEWSEINWEMERWEIPAERMKMKREHIVPLSTQALDILREHYSITGKGEYVFPCARGGSRCLSDNGIRTALRIMGYDNKTMTPHGFRAMARTLLDEELGFRVEWISQQLSHAVSDASGRAYNRTTYLDGRIQMMQDWADYLDRLREVARHLALNAA